MNPRSPSFSSGLMPGPTHVRRASSISSRLSSAVSIAEQGGGEASDNAPGQGLIEEEIAEIKRYEVRVD